MNNEERNIKLCPFQMLKSGGSLPYCVEEYCAWWHIRCGTKKAGCCSLAAIATTLEEIDADIC